MSAGFGPGARGVHASLVLREVGTVREFPIDDEVDIDRECPCERSQKMSKSMGMEKLVLEDSGIGSSLSGISRSLPKESSMLTSS